MAIGLSGRARFVLDPEFATQAGESAKSNDFLNPKETLHGNQ
jgi:hypothetical protein